MRKSLIVLWLGAWAASAVCRAPTRAAPAPPDAYTEGVQPFLERFCFECHAGAEPEGELRLDLARGAEALQADRETWLRVRAVLHSGEMPPPEASARPSPAEVASASSAVAAILAAGVDLADPGRVTVRRLNRSEYDATLRDLLGLHLELAAEFPDDDLGHGFDTHGDVLTVSPLLLERALAAAERAAGEAFPGFTPLDARVEAEAATRRGSGGVRQGWAVLSTNGEFAQTVDIPHSGDYVLEARVYGDQAGPEPALAAFRVDGQRVARREVTAERGAPGTIRARVTLSRGRHELAVAFTNDYYRPEDPDPGQRDRNLAVDWFAVRGPESRPQPTWAQRRYDVQPPPSGADPAAWLAATRRVLAPLATRAYRRPLADGELERLCQLVLAECERGEDWDHALQLGVQAILVSPAFLFRWELDPAPEDPHATRALDDFELATRLSYFLWSSLPDDELFELARRGALRAELPTQARRLLDDPRAQALVSQFFGQWLGLRELERVDPDPLAFPEFDEPLRAAMRAETELVCEAILREGRPAADLIGARFSFVNERLARHYGIPGVRGVRFRRVALPPERAGVWTHASVLTVTSNPTRTSPVKRGKWLLQRVLAAPPPPPPPGVGSLAETEAAAQGASVRAQLDAHRTRADCRVCHARMDNLGFALERFDGIGAWRSPGADATLDDRGVLPDGTTLDGSDGLGAYLRGQARTFLRGLAEQLLVYGLGRGPLPADGVALERLIDELGPRARLDDLIVGLVQLDAFTRRRGEGTR